jgi:hypothetical protein
MDSRRKLVWWPLLSVAALVVSLAFPVLSQADNKPKPPAPKKGQANPAASTTLRFEQAQALRKAFIALAGANHDYNGHRVKAMRAVLDAVHLLDDHVMKHGTAQQQAATKKENAAVAQAEAAAKLAPMLREPQPASDLQLRQAGKLLVEVQASLAEHKQKPALGHVDTAIKEIGIALNVR